jgi:hypothetical protein
MSPLSTEQFARLNAGDRFLLYAATKLAGLRFWIALIIIATFSFADHLAGIGISLVSGLVLIRYGFERRSFQLIDALSECGLSECGDRGALERIALTIKRRLLLELVTLVVAMGIALAAWAYSTNMQYLGALALLALIGANIIRKRASRRIISLIARAQSGRE